MTTQQRIDEIIKRFGNPESAQSDAILKLMLEALVMEARNEELKLQLKQLKK